MWGFHLKFLRHIPLEIPAFCNMIGFTPPEAICIANKNLS